MSSSIAILSSIKDKERRLKDFKDKHSFEQSRDILCSLRKEFRILILDYSQDKCHSNDLIGHLWKICFYKQIEDFRKAMKAAKQRSEADDSLPSESLSSLVREFSAFLTDSVRYFLKLMNDLEKKALEACKQRNELDQAIYFIYRCLLYLGDLSRYRELYSEKTQKDFSDSVRFYEKAALLMPASGNPHNQLAMLATYNEAESTALYHYCRSIMSQQPFCGGLENLARLFCENTATFDQLQRQKMKEMLKSSRNESFFRFKFFLTSFVRLHGLLFGLSVRMHAENILLSCDKIPAENNALLLKLNSQLSPILAVERENIFKYCEDIMSSLLEDFETVVTFVKMSDLHLLRLIGISIFSIHFAEKDFGKVLLESQLKQALTGGVNPIDHQVEFRSKVQTFSLLCIFGIVSRASGKLLKLSSNEKPNKLLDKLYPMLSLFCLWAQQNNRFLFGTDVSDKSDYDLVKPSVFEDKDNRKISEWMEKYTSDKELSRLESRSRSNMKTAITLVAESMPSIMKKFEMVDDGGALRELAEIRGFLPVCDKLEELFVDFSPLKKQSLWLQDSSAKVARQKIIWEFSKFVCSLPQHKEDSNHPPNSSAPIIANHILASEEAAVFDSLPEDKVEMFNSPFKFPPAEDIGERVREFEQIFDLPMDEKIFEDLDDDVVFQPAFSIINQSTNFRNGLGDINAEEFAESDIANDILASLGIFKDQSDSGKLINGALWSDPSSESILGNRNGGGGQQFNNSGFFPFGANSGSTSQQEHLNPLSIPPPPGLLSVPPGLTK